MKFGIEGLKVPDDLQVEWSTERGECAAGALECGGLTPPWNLRSAGRLQ